MELCPKKQKEAHRPTERSDLYAPTWWFLSFQFASKLRSWFSFDLKREDTLKSFSQHLMLLILDRPATFHLLGTCHFSP